MVEECGHHHKLYLATMLAARLPVHAVASDREPNDKEVFRELRWARA